MKQKLFEMIQVTVLFHTFPRVINCFGLTKTEMGAKLGYKSGWEPQLSFWGPACSVICTGHS